MRLTERVCGKNIDYDCLYQHHKKIKPVISINLKVPFKQLNCLVVRVYSLCIFVFVSRHDCLTTKICHFDIDVLEPWSLKRAKVWHFKEVWDGLLYILLRNFWSMQFSSLKICPIIHSLSKNVIILNTRTKPLKTDRSFD